ncbi:hypothetical protein CIB84_003287 [Bambusicola thoracicus]|uniref:Uncharacterized protein n=1 Tax=Bambusicola thoracicus TaxID=9083 RepID=A0A2P4T9C7_BAMTH|nr:hypothetical protein CIB84_003287 [Bambusicola thoracicus]
MLLEHSWHSLVQEATNNLTIWFTNVPPFSSPNLCATLDEMQYSERHFDFPLSRREVTGMY